MSPQKRVAEGNRGEAARTSLPEVKGRATANARMNVSAASENREAQSKPARNNEARNNQNNEAGNRGQEGGPRDSKPSKQGKQSQNKSAENRRKSEEKAQPLGVAKSSLAEAKVSTKSSTFATTKAWELLFWARARLRTKLPKSGRQTARCLL